MKKIIALAIAAIVTGCGSDVSTANLLVKGTVKGLKKGHLYLQKVEDTLLVSVDSIEINGASAFVLSTLIEEPEMYYLMLDKNAKEEDRIGFFANKGTTEINTTLKNFVFDAKIKGSPQQNILQQYLELSSRYTNQNLDLIKENFEAISNNDSLKASEVNKKQDNLTKIRYLSTINFALNNKTSQVAPYLALTEVYDANLKYLDTIYVSLPDSIAISKYGKELKKFIEERRKANKLK